MPSFGPLLGSLLPAGQDAAALAILLVILPLFLIFTVRAKGGAYFPLRPLPAYARLQELVHQAIESGKPIHVGLGSGEVGGPATTEALMGLTVFDYVARHAAASNQTVLGTTGDPTILATAQGVLQRARMEAGYPEYYQGREVSYAGPDPLAYAASAADAVGREAHTANVLLGRFGAEGLWMAEAMRTPAMAQLGGSSDPRGVALLAASLDEVVIGEEVFAAGAYLHRPSHLGSLAMQDMLRMVMILSILVGVILFSLGMWR
jgi:hypothetical protein